MRFQNEGPCRCRAGFSRLDLGAVVAALGLLAGLLLTAGMNTSAGSESTRCLWNFKVQAAAWSAHAAEHPQLLRALHGAVHQQGGGTPDQFARLETWASGWLDWNRSADNTNVLWLRSPSFTPYLPHGTNAARNDVLFRCPSDRYLSGPQRQRWGELGIGVRVRSYSQSTYVGPGNVETGPTLPIYKHVERLDELETPGRTFVFLEEHPDSINDPGFFGPDNTRWIDFPASHHGRAANFAYADGHAELHRWQEASTVATVRGAGYIGPTSKVWLDLSWVMAGVPQARLPVVP